VCLYVRTAVCMHMHVQGMWCMRVRFKKYP